MKRNAITIIIGKRREKKIIKNIEVFDNPDLAIKFLVLIFSLFSVTSEVLVLLSKLISNISLLLIKEIELCKSQSIFSSVPQLKA